MPHYKDRTNKVHWIDSDDFIPLLPAGCVSITEEEAVAIANPPPSLEDLKQAVKAQIVAIEQEQIMPRGLREFLLLQLPQIAQTGGVTEEQLYVANPFYKKLKDVSAQIAALRAQI